MTTKNGNMAMMTWTFEKLLQWESSAVKYGNTEHGNPGGTIGFKECDQKVLFILQIDKKSPLSCSYIVNGNTAFQVL